MISVWKILESQKETGSKPILDGYRIPFIFKSGGDGPGMGYRVNGAVVARAYLPEFATDRVVYCYDRYLAAIYRNLLAYYYHSKSGSLPDVYGHPGPSRSPMSISRQIR